MPISRGFASDNASGIHPKVLEWIQKANEGHVIGYGDDPFTHQAEQLFKKHFGEKTTAYLVLTGTGANVLGISQLLDSTEAVICAETAHINEHECGALQKYNGSRLLPIATPNGKLTIELIQSRMNGFGDEHYSQPKLISITQVTETGTLYTPEEIKAIARYAHEHGLFVHMDGARLSNAAAALNLEFKKFTVDCGVDLLSFGGTKNGLMGAEAILFFNSDLTKRFEYLRKQSMQLASKMRFISAQFIALLENDLWLKNARHSNQMATLFAEELSAIKDVNLIQQPAANILFVQVPKRAIKSLQQQFDFYITNEGDSILRLVCSFDTEEQDIKRFVNALKTV